MTTYQLVDTNAARIISSLNITGTAGAGYINLIQQTAKPTVTAGTIVIYSDTSSRISWTAGGSALTIDTSTMGASSTWTLPDASDTLVGIVTAATLANKTIIGGSSGNTVTVTAINGVTVSGTPSNGQVLTATSSSAANWAASAAATYCNTIIFSFSTTVSSFVTVASLVFLGTATQTLRAAYITVTVSASGGTVRIYDVTHSLVICSYGSTTISGRGVVMTAPTNLSAGPALWQIQYMANSSTTITLDGVVLKFS